MIESVRRLSLCAVLCGVLALAASAVHAQTATFQFDLPAQSLADALRAVGRQTSKNILFDPALVEGISVPALRAELTVSDAVKQLLSGTKLSTQEIASDTVLIRNGTRDVAKKPAASKTTAVEGTNGYTRMAQAEEISEKFPEATSGEKRVQLEEVRVTIPEVLVVGSKILNMDIPRTRDDAQPYVIMDRKLIENSGAANLTELFRQRLPMNMTAPSPDQRASTEGLRSSVNLRGLGEAQTLILIDGRRSSGASTVGGVAQGDINGIPLTAIERIEILPTTASGIYGGNATGGVINIVMRRDYAGVEVKTTYDNTFSTDAPIRRVDLSGGFNLEGGKTNVLIAGSYSDNAGLRQGDRDFAAEGRARILANNPNSILTASTPPLGRTANIRSVSGAPLFGPGTANLASVPVGYSGGGGLAPLQAGRYELDLAPTTETGGARYGLLSASEAQSVIASVRREFTPGLQAFIEANVASNRGDFAASNSATAFTVNANAPNNPFGQAIRVTTPVVLFDDEWHTSLEERRAAAGVIFRLPADWQLLADYTFSSSRHHFSVVAGALNAAGVAAIANGTLDVLRDTVQFPLDVAPYMVVRTTISPNRATLHNPVLRAAGPLFTLPAGPLTVSAMVERRDQSFDSWSNFTNTGALGSTAPSRSQQANSAYLEAKVPLFSARNARPLLRELELQLALRHDDYKTKGANNFVTPTAPTVATTENHTRSTDPTVGLRYRPFESLLLRASYGTGFVPPTVNQLISNPASATLVQAALVDTRRGNSPTVVPLAGVQGGNPGLKPENSESYSAGFIITPSALPGLRFSADWSRIEKTDIITALGAQAVIDNEAFLPGRVRRGANLPGDPAGWPGPIDFIDLTSANISRATYEAVDLAFDYTRESAAWGDFTFSLLATRQLSYETQVAPLAAAVENLGYSSFSLIPLKWKANASLVWSRNGWSAGWLSRYYDDYYVANPTVVANAGMLLSQGNGGRVPRQIYHDAFATYQFDRSGATGSRLSDWSSGLEISLGIKNVFNTEPPFDANVSATPSFYSRLGDPRLASYYVTLKKAF